MQVEACKRNMNTFAFVGDLEKSPEVSCVYHSEVRLRMQSSAKSDRISIESHEAPSMHELERMEVSIHAAIVACDCVANARLACHMHAGGGKSVPEEPKELGVGRWLPSPGGGSARCRTMIEFSAVTSCGVSRMALYLYCCNISVHTSIQCQHQPVKLVTLTTLANSQQKTRSAKLGQTACKPMPSLCTRPRRRCSSLQPSETISLAECSLKKMLVYFLPFMRFSMSVATLKMPPALDRSAVCQLAAGSATSDATQCNIAHRCQTLLKVWFWLCLTQVALTDGGTHLLGAHRRRSGHRSSCWRYV